jgi:hypothetical protein
MRSIIVCALVLLCACQSVAGPTEDVLRELLAQGHLTQDQYDRLVAALTRGDWSGVLNFLQSAGEVVVAVVLSYLGITWRRGPITARKGLSPQQ